MARIRTIKPEFWEDETIATLSLRARLLFIATWNMADDEGLLRWTPEYVKANSIVYDGSLREITAAMKEIVTADLIFPYKGGRMLQPLAYVINFRKHQRINRPQPSKLPPPSIQNAVVREMYARRDGWRCHLCKEEINQIPSRDERFNLSLDHIVPRYEGGNDYPTNLRAAHCSCNKSRRNAPLTESGIDSLNDSPPEWNGGEQGGEGEGNKESPPTPPQVGGLKPSLRSQGENPRAIAARAEAEKLQAELRECETCGDAGWTCDRCKHRARRLEAVSA